MPTNTYKITWKNIKFLEEIRMFSVNPYNICFYTEYTSKGIACLDMPPGCTIWLPRSFSLLYNMIDINEKLSRRLAKPALEAFLDSEIIAKSWLEHVIFNVKVI